MVAPVIELHSVRKVILIDEVEVHPLLTSGSRLPRKQPVTRRAHGIIHRFAGQVVEEPLEDMGAS